MKVTFARVVHSEWIKFRSLRSSWITLLAALAIMVAFGAILGYSTGSGWATADPEDRAVSGALRGYFLGQLLIGVLGVLFVSGEYGTGMIRSTLTAVPRRLPVVAAKAVVFALVAAVSMAVAGLLAFLVSAAILSSYGHGVSPASPGAVRAVAGTAFYLAMIGLLAGGLGWIVRSTAGGIATLFALLLIVPTMLQLLTWPWLQDLGRYLPSEAARSFLTGYHAPGSLTAGAGLAVLAGWVVVVLGLGTAVLKRRDG
jgi:ABC-type transport system involved in multi-copper enzyme maturation permease subunit